MSERIVIPEFLKKIVLEKPAKAGVTLAQFLSLIEFENQKIECRAFFNENSIFRIFKDRGSFLYERHG